MYACVFTSRASLLQPLLRAIQLQRSVEERWDPSDSGATLPPRWPRFPQRPRLLPYRPRRPCLDSRRLHFLERLLKPSLWCVCWPSES